MFKIGLYIVYFWHFRISASYIQPHAHDQICYRSRSNYKKQNLISLANLRLVTKTATLLRCYFFAVILTRQTAHRIDFAAKLRSALVAGPAVTQFEWKVESENGTVCGRRPANRALKQRKSSVKPKRAEVNHFVLRTRRSREKSLRQRIRP